VARAVAEPLGITQIHAELLPDQKAEKVVRWWGGEVVDHPPDTTSPPRHPPTSVAFVGDGLNDAPALARAAVGLAVGSGADVAAEAGDIVLMGDPLRPLPLLVRLSRETVRIIRQNIVIFAFGVNIAGVVLTAWLWPLFAASPAWYEAGPLAAVIYHQLGSLAVLLNSMRLLAFDRRPTGRAVTGVREGLQHVDQWLGRAFNVDDWLHGLAHRWRAVAAAGVFLLLIGGAASGFTVIGPDEVGVVKRFGRVRPDDLAPGLHWRWPWPVEAVTRVQPARVRTVEVGYRRMSPAAAAPRELTWASAHGDDVRRIPDEALMVTGDGNLVELLASVRYQVAEPRAYLAVARDSEELLRAAAEAALREEVAGRPFLDLLTVERGRFQAAVLDRLRRRAVGLGLALEGVDLHDLHPPPEVVEAYHGVARAAESRDRQVNDAHAAATRTLRAAEANALRTVRDAEAKAAEQVGLAGAMYDTFAAWHDARHRLGAVEEVQLAAALFGRVLIGEQSAAPAHAEYQRQRQDRLASRRALIDLRLSWEAVARALADRSKVIVDAEKVSGRRQLLLFDPEQVRPPVPLPPVGERP
jgi:Cu+-exporting ATPase